MLRIILAATALLGSAAAADAATVTLPFDTLGTAYGVVGTLVYDTDANPTGVFPDGQSTFNFYPAILKWDPVFGTSEEVGGNLSFRRTGLLSTLSFNVNYSGSGREFVSLTFNFFSPDGRTNELPLFVPSTSGTFTRNSNQGDFKYTVAAITPGVPEPASWALMIGGIGLAGGMLRRRRARTVTYA